jgi:hypothetical protein
MPMIEMKWIKATQLLAGDDRKRLASQQVEQLIKEGGLLASCILHMKALLRVI